MDRSVRTWLVLSPPVLNTWKHLSTNGEGRRNFPFCSLLYLLHLPQVLESRRCSTDDLWINEWNKQKTSLHSKIFSKLRGLLSKASAKREHLKTVSRSLECRTCQGSCCLGDFSYFKSKKIMSHCLGKAMESQILKGENRTNEFLCSLLFYQEGKSRKQHWIKKQSIKQTI